MKVSIIIINFNTPNLTINCIESLIKFHAEIDLEIIVVDNASSDNSLEMLKNSFGHTIKLIPSDINLGFAGGNNLGAKSATGKYLIFLNSDTIINSDFITPCVKILEENENIGAISPRLILPDKTLQQSSYGIFPTIWRLLLQKTKKDPIAQYKNGYFLTDWISGCAFIIKKSIFQEIGAWDEKFFLYYEDIEICKRLHDKSYQVAVSQNASIVHLGGQSLKLNKVKENHFYTSQDYYFKKHHGAFNMLIVKVLRFFYKIYKNILK